MKSSLCFLYFCSCKVQLSISGYDIVSTNWNWLIICESLDVILRNCERSEKEGFEHCWFLAQDYSWNIRSVLGQSLDIFKHNTTENFFSEWNKNLVSINEPRSPEYKSFWYCHKPSASKIVLSWSYNISNSNKILIK